MPPDAIHIDTKYSIGPNCARQHWETILLRNSDAPKVPKADHGPSYFSSLPSIAKSNIRNRTGQKTADAYLRLLDINETIITTITGTGAVQAAATPTLMHPDFHSRNIFVALDDPTQITGIIDWQSTTIEPAFVHAAETPDFAEELQLDETLDGNRDDPEMEIAKADAQRCAKTWAVMACICPKLREAMALDPLVCRYLAAASSRWLTNITCIRSLLTDLRQRWMGLSFPGEMLYQPIQHEEDVTALNQELDGLQSTQRLRMYLSRLLRCYTDGWVEADRWQEVLPVYREEYARFIGACVASWEEHESES
ncbi:hypothetical protein DV737_g1653, partial [Chaetothyriales sp. CBS 132003]